VTYPAELIGATVCAMALGKFGLVVCCIGAVYLYGHVLAVIQSTSQTRIIASSVLCLIGTLAGAKVLGKPGTVAGGFLTISLAAAMEKYIFNVVIEYVLAALESVSLPGIITAVVLLVIVLSFILEMLGFGAGGIVANSVAAVWQSTLGNVPAGSLFSLLQSLGTSPLGIVVFVAIGLGWGGFLLVSKMKEMMMVENEEFQHLINN